MRKTALLVSLFALAACNPGPNGLMGEYVFGPSQQSQLRCGDLAAAEVQLVNQGSIKTGMSERAMLCAMAPHVAYWEIGGYQGRYDQATLYDFWYVGDFGPTYLKTVIVEDGKVTGWYD